MVSGILKTMPKFPIRPGYQTESELADLLWNASTTIRHAQDAIEEYCTRQGDLHGAQPIIDSIDECPNLAAMLANLALHLDRCVSSRH